MDRRNFIGKTSLLACLNFLGLTSMKASFSKKQGNEILSSYLEGDIIRRKLGNTGLELPVVNMGVMNATIPGLVKRSFERGVKLFDTAWFYQNGMNEKMVGDTLESMGVRGEALIMTKVFLKETERNLYKPEIKQLFIDRFEESLRRLKTGYVDILLYHSAGDVKELNNPYILEAFEELKEAGKYRIRGVSLHGDDPAMIDDIADKKFYEVVLVMFNIAYAGDTRLINAMQNAAGKGIGVIAMKTQCGGGGYNWWDKHGDTREALGGKLNNKAMLKWVLHHDFITMAIPGYTTYDQLEEVVSVAYDLEYSSEEKEFLDKAGVQIAGSFCVQCRKCSSTCPGKVDIPSLMRTYMYAYMYRNMEHAAATVSSLPEKTGIKRCYECKTCTATCKRTINISERIEALKELNFRYV